MTTHDYVLIAVISICAAIWGTFPQVQTFIITTIFFTLHTIAYVVVGIPIMIYSYGTYFILNIKDRLCKTQ